MSLSSNKIAECRKLHKLAIMHGFQNKCGVCGYSRCHQAFDFHHLDPEAKRESVARLLQYSFEILLEEASKCAMLCRNCHAELHSNFITKDLICIKFSAKDAIEFRNLASHRKSLKVVKKKCPNCGLEFLGKTKSCSMKCARELSGLLKRKVSNELLMSVFLGEGNKSYSKTARLLGILSNNGVKKRIIKLGLVAQW